MVSIFLRQLEKFSVDMFSLLSQKSRWSNPCQHNILVSRDNLKSPSSSLLPKADMQICNTCYLLQATALQKTSCSVPAFTDQPKTWRLKQQVSVEHLLSWEDLNENVRFSTVRLTFLLHSENKQMVFKHQETLTSPRALSWKLQM